MGTDLFGAAGRPGAAGAEARAGAELNDPLRLTGVKAGEGGTIAIDDYIRFAFESPAGTGGTGLVMVRDPEGETLAELRIDLATGRLRGAALVNFTRRAVRQSLADWLPDTETEGLPLLDPGAFDREAMLPSIDRAQPIDLVRDAAGVVVRIGRAQPDAVVRADQALFLFAGGVLCGFGADGLAPREVALAAD